MITQALPQFFKLAPIPFQLFSADGRSLATNEAYRAMFGCDPSPAYCAFEDEVAKKRGVAAAITRASRGEAVALAPFWHEPCDSECLPNGQARIGIGMTLFPIGDDEGKVSCVGATFRDVTESIRWAKPAAGHARGEILLNVGTWTLEFATGESGTHRLAWSDETFRIFGYRPGEFAVTLERFREHVHPEDKEAIQLAMEQARTSGADYATEHRIVRRDGEVRLLHEHGSLERDAQSGRILRIHGTVQDITDRALAERRMAEHARLLDATLDGADAQVFTLDRDGRYIVFNQQHAFFMRETWGVEIAAGTSFFDIPRPVEHARRLEEMAGRVLGGESVREEFEAHAWNGRDERWLTSNWNPMRDESGAVSGIVANTQDLTAVHRAEERFRLLFEAAPVAMMMVATGGEIANANAAAGRLFGYAGDEWQGKCVDDLVPARDREGHRKGRQAFEQAPEARRMGPGRDLYALRKDGSEFPVEVVLSPLHAAGSSWVACGIVDVSERKLAERTLLNVNASLEALVAERTGALQRSLAIQTTLSEGAPESIWLFEPGIGITYVNRRWCQIFGGKPEDWHGEAWRELIAPEEREAYLASWDKAAATGEPFHAEVRLRDAGGAIRNFDIKAAAVHDAGGKVVAWVGVNTDISVHKAMEVALRKANRELEAFSYSISHDLRAPLRVIDGFSRILLEEAAGQLDERSRSHLDRVRRSAQHMGLLIDDLLEFSRLGRHELRFSSIDHAALVASVIEGLEAERGERDIEWRVAKLPVSRGDPGLLSQVWANLLANAVKFTRDRTHAVIEIGAEGVEGGQGYFVRDNGVGFEMRYASRLFGVFQRLHRADEFPGTGVGLAIVSRIVERHGGMVSAEAELGSGACFRFTLPDVPPVTAVEAPS